MWRKRTTAVLSACCCNGNDAGKAAVPIKSDLCELCQTDGGAVLYRGQYYRVVRVTGGEGDSYRGFCRVIWNEHIKEMSDLVATDRQLFMDAVFQVEAVLRASLLPEKINLASLGNMTPHLHWHVIPRFTNDVAYPKPIWAVDVAPPGQIDKLAPGFSIRNAGAHVEWAEAVSGALKHNDQVNT